MEKKFAFCILAKQCKTDRKKQLKCRNILSAAAVLMDCVFVFVGVGVATTKGANDFLYPFFLARGILSFRPDGNS